MITGALQYDDSLEANAYSIPIQSAVAGEAKPKCLSRHGGVRALAVTYVLNSGVRGT